MNIVPGMKVKDLLVHDQLTVDAYADRAEIVRTDPVTYQTKGNSIQSASLVGR